MVKTQFPRVYVACLASYNAGILHGRWVELDSTDAGINCDTLTEGTGAMLGESPIKDAEEWAIHDFDGFGEKAHRPLCPAEITIWRWP